MSNSAQLPIRLFGDLATLSIGLNLNTGSGPGFVVGDTVEIDLGIGEGGMLYTNSGALPFVNLASVSCQLFQSEGDTNAPMLSQTVVKSAMNLALTQAQWNNNTNTGLPQTPPLTGSSYQHAQFLFTATLTGAIATVLSGAPSMAYWLRIFGTTSDTPAQTFTILQGSIQVKNAPLTTLPAATAPGFKIVTDVVTGLQTIALQDPVTGDYYALEIDTANGVRTLSLSDQAY